MSFYCLLHIQENWLLATWTSTVTAKTAGQLKQAFHKRLCTLATNQLEQSPRVTVVRPPKNVSMPKKACILFRRTRRTLKGSMSGNCSRIPPDTCNAIIPHWKIPILPCQLVQCGYLLRYLLQVITASPVQADTTAHACSTQCHRVLSARSLLIARDDIGEYIRMASDINNTNCGWMVVI